MLGLGRRWREGRRRQRGKPGGNSGLFFVRGEIPTIKLSPAGDKSHAFRPSSAHFVQKNRQKGPHATLFLATLQVRDIVIAPLAPESMGEFMSYRCVVGL
jgi:hypothetical protein